MGKRLPIFMGEVPEYSVLSGHVHITWRELELVLPVSVMLAGMAGAKRAIDDWQRRGGAAIVPFKSKGGGH